MPSINRQSWAAALRSIYFQPAEVQSPEGVSSFGPFLIVPLFKSLPSGLLSLCTLTLFAKESPAGATVHGAKNGEGSRGRSKRGRGDANVDADVVIARHN